MLEILAEELSSGVVIARKYRLEREVGRGGMGVVWAATHEVTGKSFALKFLDAERAAEPKSHERMLREARAACTVRHANVAEILDVSELESGVPFLVMELLEGETLAARLGREKTLPMASIRDVFVPVIDALAAAHAAGVVHRDLKPENVFLLDASRGGPSVKVVDFGVAKLCTSFAEAPSTTTTGALVGTPIYMAPEQVFADRDIDGRADIWALGVLLYEALSGKAPTSADTVGQVLKAVTRDPIVPLLTVAPDTPGDVAELVMRLLSKERDARPSLDEARRVLQGEGASAAVVVPAREPSSTRRSTVAASLAAFGLLVLGVGAFFMYSRPSAPPHGASSSAATGPAPRTEPSTRLAPATPVMGTGLDGRPMGPDRGETALAASGPPSSLVATKPTHALPAGALSAAAPVAPASKVVTSLVVPSPSAPTSPSAAWHGNGIVLTHDRK